VELVFELTVEVSSPLAEFPVLEVATSTSSVFEEPPVASTLKDHPTTMSEYAKNATIKYVLNA
jgi:hypothetical protein